jgi:hypothetical protein
LRGAGDAAFARQGIERDDQVEIEARQPLRGGGMSPWVSPRIRMPFVSTEGETGAMKVSRGSVGRFLASAVESPNFLRKSVALSGMS